MILHQSPSAPRGCRLKLRSPRTILLAILLAAGLSASTSVLDYWFASSTNSGAAKDRPTDTVPIAAKSLHEVLNPPDIIPSHHHAFLGRKAPKFCLADCNGNVASLDDLRDGRPLVLIFHNGYHCVNCVRQLVDIDKDLRLFDEAGARVAAISADAPELTQKRLQQYGAFHFPVLSDPDNKVAEAYGVCKRPQSGAGAIRRHGIFIIDQDGAIRWVNIGDAPFRRNPALLCLLTTMEGTRRCP